MKQRIEVRSQAEFDACVAVGNIAIVIGCRVVAWGNSSVVARGNSSVVARGNSSVVAWGNSSVVAWENSSVVARENSSVVARGNVFVRLFSALSVKASAFVSVVKHGPAHMLAGGRVMDAAPEPKTGAEWCDFNGIDPQTVDYRVPHIDAAILASVEKNAAAGTNGLDMGSWHGDDRKANEEHWCETTHCRAGYAICLAGAPGWALEKKFGPEIAGRMIYAVSRPHMELPSFHASTGAAMEDLERCAALDPLPA